MKDVYDLGWVESVSFKTDTSERRNKKKTFVKAKVSNGEELEKGFDERESLKE